jgi:hypothetical protein
MALSTDATWLRLPLLMLLGPAAAPSLSSRIVLSLSHVFVGTTGRKGRGRSAWGNVTLPLYFFPVLFPLSLSLDFLSPPLLCASRLSVLARWNWKRGSGLRNRKLGKRSPASSATFLGLGHYGQVHILNLNRLFSYLRILKYSSMHKKKRKKKKRCEREKMKIDRNLKSENKRSKFNVYT